MRVLVIKDGEIRKSTDVKEGTSLVVKRMVSFIEQEDQQREIALVGDDGREMVRFANVNGSPEARLKVRDYLLLVNRAVKAHKLESMLKDIAERRAEREE